MSLITFMKINFLPRESCTICGPKLTGYSSFSDLVEYKLFIIFD